MDKGEKLSHCSAMSSERVKQSAQFAKLQTRIVAKALSTFAAGSLWDPGSEGSTTGSPMKIRWVIVYTCISRADVHVIVDCGKTEWL